MKLMLGDSKDKLKELQDESIDLLVSDPPYGMSFMGKSWDKALPDINVWKECVRVLKPGSFGFIMCIPRQDCLSRMIISLEDAGFKVNFSPIYWTYATGFPKAHNIGKAIDKKFGKKRKVVGTRFTGAALSGKLVGTESTSFGSGINEVDITAPASEEAKKYEGSYGGFQPKPAVEVIIVVQKPMSEKRFVDQAINNGKGITWLDDCMIPYKSDEKIDFKRMQNQNIDTTNVYIGGAKKGDSIQMFKLQGRFPANLLVSDEILGEKYSRFFSLDAWAEKNLPFLIVPKANKKEKNAGCDKLEYRSNGVRISLICKKCGGVWIGSAKCKCEKPDWVKPKIKNNHPTVKPIKLMSYLITMGSREGDIVLDPFMGSGTTGCAAVLLRRNFVGVEKEEDYIEIAESRIEYWSKKSDKEKLF